jgi:hypothetical protein
LFTTSRFWLQAGYNNFYGVSGGAGGRFFKRLSLGALLEFGTDTSLDGFDPSIELVTAYSFGKTDGRKKVVGFDEGDAGEELQPEEEIRTEEEQQEEEEIAEVRRKELEQATDSIAAAREKQQLETDKALAQQRKVDSIAAVRKEEALAQAEKPKAGEKYEEAKTEDGLEPGYYLITNVFGTKRYFDGFMKTITARGLQPKSFYRSVNKYNYVYLERYDTLSEARKARDSKFNGRYTDSTWIFRVVAK